MSRYFKEAYIQIPFSAEVSTEVNFQKNTHLAIIGRKPQNTDRLNDITCR